MNNDYQMHRLTLGINLFYGLQFFRAAYLPNKIDMKRVPFLSLIAILAALCNQGSGQDLVLNDLEYFEVQGVNILVYSNLFTGGFRDYEFPGWKMRGNKKLRIGI